MSEPDLETKEVDIFRDTLLRYLGYTNEVGESLRPLMPPVFVTGTYVVSFAYVLADAIDKSYKSWQQSHPTNVHQWASATHDFADTLVWQTFASVLVPGFVINRCVAASTWGLRKTMGAQKLTTSRLRFLPTVLGLALIPFICHPIDMTTEKAMDAVLRPYAQKWKDTAVQSLLARRDDDEY
ncbi:MAG: hypothetical protein MHM6MM_003177 [Cercozoa sp. M6MM]